MIRLLVVALVLNVLLLALKLPDFPVLPWLAVEAPLLAALFWLWPRGRARTICAYATGTGYGALVLLAAADVLVRQSLGRSFNLYLDYGLLGAAFNLLTTNLGTPLAVLATLLIAVILLGAGGLVGRLLLSTDGPSRHRRVGIVVLLAGLVITPLMPAPGLPVGVTAAAMVAQQLSLARATHLATAAFDARLNPDQGGTSLAGPRALSRLQNVDLIMGLVESYGITTVMDPRYRELTGARLDAMARALDGAGVHVASGRLRSPVQGGQSWLAHATLLSGQWVDTQLDYEILLASGYPTLIDDMRRTGHDTVAVMPAITRDWPEGRQFGYDRIHDADTMDYAGPALNWVTMPDQYTWSWFQRRIRAPATTPVFAEIALISSHAPWVPILPVLPDWSAIGDGTVFRRWENSGEAPVSLWRDPERVREHYGRAIDYALHVITEYAVRHVDANTLLVIVGDHQPAPLITGPDASRDAVVHLISGNRALLAPFVGDGTDAGLPAFRWGTRPATDEAGATMDELRPFLHRHY